MSAEIEKTQYLTYRIRRAIHKTRMKDIIFIESNQRKLTLHLADGNKVDFYGKLKNVYQEQLHSLGFFHIHASYAVNYNYVTEFKFREVILAGGITLPVSPLRRKEVRKSYFTFVQAVDNNINYP